jgi:hypothetical protein
MTENMLLEKAIKRWLNNAKATATKFNWALSESQLKGLCCNVACIENTLEARALYNELKDDDVKRNNIFIAAANRLCSSLTEEEIKEKTSAIWSYGTGRMYLG